MSKDYKFNPEMYKTVAKNVRKFRKEKGMSIDELCKYAEIKKEFWISRYQYGYFNLWFVQKKRDFRS